MNPDLRKLIRLQTVDLCFQELREKIDRSPEVSKALDQKLLTATTVLQKVRDRVKASQTNRKKLEMEVGSIEAKITRYREQLMSVKTNDEYRALLKEIEYEEAAKGKVEDELIKLMLEADSIESEIKAAEAHLQEDQKLVDTERRQLQEENRRQREALDAYAKERRELKESISTDLLARYERIRKVRRGIAVAEARDEACSVCNVRIRPQVFQEIRKNDQIITCDNCDRILFDPSNLDHPFETV